MGDGDGLVSESDAPPHLSTDWSASLGLTAPVVCAPMGGAAGGRLAGAVSRAGALGMIGLGSAGSPALLARELAALEETGGTGGAPFGIGVVDWVARRTPELLDHVLAAKPALVSVGFTSGRFEWVEPVHRSGALATTQVYDVAEAVAARDAGVDVIVARGAEGGGHGDPRVGTLPLLDGVLDAIGGEAAVLAAGGVSSARALAAVLAAGADGAWIGTAFAVCEESLFSDTERQVLFAADGADTVNTRTQDVAAGLPWPDRFPERVVRTAFTDEWAGREDALRADADARAAFVDALARTDLTVVPLDAGQGVGVLRESRPAADVIADLVAGAHALLARWT
ncbi:NAD(P)H-dependent flavin oxidoreductase [Agromyces larvae]|uniref:Nitronate monooxygenase n=1 Tax=Agromyces larvae TaxID=2929802 RepID=A0ABY4C3Z2_9MICO|nr:nitronate monooxygenase [Agromyces larvae]UOE43480.1 nitronate monooxygenase [Agromyces larvae]